MNEFDFVRYMRSIAENLKAIGHNPTEKRFYRMSSLRGLEEVLTSLSSAMVPAIAVVDNPDGRFLEDPSQVRDREMFTFLVFGRLIMDDYDQQEEEKKNLKSIVLKIMAKMHEHRVSDLELGTNHGLKRLDISTFSYKTISPLPDNLIAIYVNFALDSPESLTVDPDDWFE